MNITLKLFANLESFLPAGARENAVSLHIAENSTLHQLIDAHHIPRQSAHLVLVNGVFIDPADRDKAMLKNDDVLAIWPPVAGG